jgi:hypothetical protein
MGISKSEAEDTLKAEDGDVIKALIRLVRPKPVAGTSNGMTKAIK